MTDDGKLGFIGAGNMASALIKGLIQSDVYHPDQLLVSDTRREALDAIFSQYGVQSCATNNALADKSDIIVLSIKPQNMRQVLEGIKQSIRDDHLIISIAAGIPLEMIHAAVERDCPLIRVMPNTPALVQQGASALTAGKSTTPEHMALAKSIFSAVGETVEVEEKMMDAVTALSGSGPGYIFRMMECMVQAGIAMGMSRETALGLVIQTFLGAAQLAKESDRSLAELREMVSSPGGTTAAGLAILNEMGLRDIIIKACQTACRRSVELGKG